MLLERIARVCHEVNRAYCRFLGDTSQVPWEEAPGWQKESAVAGVEALINNPSLTPEQQHELWWQQKRSEGWQYGPVKDAVTKQHPCMLPYAELPQEQRTKDDLFQAVVRAMAFHPTQGTQDDRPRQSDK